MSIYIIITYIHIYIYHYSILIIHSKTSDNNNDDNTMQGTRAMLETHATQVLSAEPGDSIPGRWKQNSPT